MSVLPHLLLEKLEGAFKNIDKMLVKNERHLLTRTYRDPKGNDTHNPRIKNNHQRLSYLATRIPATYTVCHEVLSRLAAYDFEFSSLLDLGAGPGTASICAKYIFPELKKILLIDQDKDFKAFAESVLTEPYFDKTIIDYKLCDMRALKTSPGHDLVMLSYGLNELRDKDAQSCVYKAWAVTEKALVIIEPGTPKAFTNLRKRRAELIQYGAKIIAPCSHQNECPMPMDLNSDPKKLDWCHFSTRVERSHLHKYIKEGTLPYEDEKFSYLIAIKDLTMLLPNNRIVKRPKRRPGHLIFDLCTSQGLVQHTVTKSQKSLYKKAQKAEWGDTLDDFNAQDK